MKPVETIPCFCTLTIGGTGKPVDDCHICKGTGRRPVKDGYLWADHIWRDEKPPSETPMAVPEPPAFTESVKPPAPPPKPVPANWKPSRRSDLRERALELAIRAAPLTGARLVNGAELLREAEHIESWIAHLEGGEA